MNSSTPAPDRPSRRSSTRSWALRRSGTPALDAETVARIAQVSSTVAYGALDRLVEAGILHEVTQSKRGGAWAATEILAEIDALNARLRTVEEV